MVLASRSGRNPGWRFKPIETALDRDLLGRSKHGLDRMSSVGADLPNCGSEHIDELGRARLQWLIVVEIITALMVLPLFAVLFRLLRTFGWANLLRVFFICAMLFIAGDMPTIWWRVSHPVISPSQATWAIALQVG